MYHGEMTNMIKKNKELLFLSIIFVLVFLFRLLVANSFNQPFIFGDELSYKTMAYAFHQYGDFYHIQSEKMAHTVDIPNFLYPLLISSSFYFVDFLHVIKIINVFLLTLSIIPAYYILKDLNCKYRLFGIILIALLPGSNYSLSVMPESMYATIFLFLIMFAMRAFNRKSSVYTVSFSLLTGLLFLTKPHAISVIVSLVIFLVMIIVVRLNQNRHSEALVFLKQLGLMIFTIPVVIVIMSYIFGGSLSFGVYSNVTDIKHAFDLNAAFINATGHIFTILFSYSIPLFFILWYLVNHNYSDSSKDEDKLLNFSLLTLLFFASVFAMVVKYTTDIGPMEHYARIHARYYYYVYPLFIISFFVFYERLRLTISKSSVFFLLLYILLISVLCVLFVYNNSDNVGFITDNIQFAWFLKLSPTIISLILFIVIIAFSLTAFVKSNLKLFFSVLLFISMLSNFGYVEMAKRYHHANATADYIKSEKIESELKKLEGKEVAIVQVNGYGVLMNTLFWSSFQFNYAKQVSSLDYIYDDIPVNTDALIVINESTVQINDYTAKKIADKVYIYSLPVDTDGYD
ncbi:hypothetical protein AB4351_21900 [Vibrio sp. 10N.261.51.F11]|uniref:hypothetical protein n=1 Tax=Vibrio sp. 10N.261.51.F11 TaxID=3229678 RepID=UPI00354DC40B